MTGILFRRLFASGVIGIVLIQPAVGALNAAEPVLSADESKTPDGKAIVERFIEVTGGKERYSAVKTQTTKASMQINALQIKIDLAIYQAGKGKMLAEIDMKQVGTTRRGVSGDVAWEVSSIQGVRILEGTEAASMLEKSDLQAAADPSKYFKSMERTGTKEIGGETCYEVTLTKRIGQPEKRYYSAKTGLMVATVATQETPMGEIEVETEISDYRDAGGLKVPFRIVQKMQGLAQEMKIQSVEFNKPIDDGKFALPEEVKAIQ
jgi:hypothetical protein